MNVLKVLCFTIVSILFIAGCSETEETPKPAPEVVVAEPVEVLPEPEPLLPEPEPEPEPIPVEVVEEVVEPDYEPPAEVAAEAAASAAEAELAAMEDRFRSGIKSAVTNVGIFEKAGRWKTLTSIDTGSCLSEKKGEYRLCTTRKVRAVPGYESADFYTLVVFNGNEYASYYQIP